MADLSDVLTTVTQLVSEAVYPNGTSQPSVVGVQVTVAAGWPIRGIVDSVMQTGEAFVSVFPTNKERVVTKFERVYQPNTLINPTLIVTVSGNQVTITGTVSTPQAVMVIVNGVGYAYQVLSTDTLDTIASSEAALIPGASALGNVITIPGAYSLVARITTPYSASEELGRQERVFMISCWTPTPTMRPQLAAPIDIFLRENYRIVLSDNFYAQVFYHHTDEIDILQKSLIYRRDLFYNIQYATTVTQDFYTITDTIENVSLVTQITP